MLELSVSTVDEIAWQVGYEDPGAFRKIFERLMGLSPGECRRRFAIRPETHGLPQRRNPGDP